MPSQSVDPRTGQPFGPTLPDSTPQEVAATAAAAAAAFGPWRRETRVQRAGALRAVADAIDGAAPALVDLADRETGLGAGRLTGEVARTTFQLRAFADLVELGSFQQVVIDPADPRPVPVGHPDLRRMLVPVGPVAVYGASNFPFAFSVAGGDTASALAAGCTVVVKAHPAHPQLSQAVFDLMRDALLGAGAPAGVVGLVSGFEAGQALVRDPHIAAAAFTGSGHGGRALFALASARPDPIPFYGELGSVNPVFVLPSAADRDDLAERYLDSLLLGAGQFCTNPSVLAVPGGSGFLETVRAAAAGRGPAVLLHAGVGEQLARSIAIVAQAPGVRVLAGRPDEEQPVGSVRSPVLFAVAAADVLSDPTVLGVECFGPVGVVVEYGTPAEALALAEAFPGALVGSVFGDAADPLAPELVETIAERVGRVTWNEWPTGVAVTAGQHHGGPWPATTNVLHTSVGDAAILRFLRPIAFQSLPAALLPPELRGE